MKTSPVCSALLIVIFVINSVNQILLIRGISIASSSCKIPEFTATVNSVDTNSIAIGWSPPDYDRVYGYFLTCSDCPQKNRTLKEDDNPHSVEGLKPVTAYTFTVIAFASGCNDSDPVTLEAKTRVPGVTNVTAESVNSTALLVTWTESEVKDVTYTVNCSGDTEFSATSAVCCCYQPATENVVIVTVKKEGFPDSLGFTARGRTTASPITESSLSVSTQSDTQLMAQWNASQTDDVTYGVTWNCSSSCNSDNTVGTSITCNSVQPVTVCSVTVTVKKAGFPDSETVTETGRTTPSPVDSSTLTVTAVSDSELLTEWKESDTPDVSYSVIWSCSSDCSENSPAVSRTCSSLSPVTVCTVNVTVTMQGFPDSKTVQSRGMTKPSLNTTEFTARFSLGDTITSNDTVTVNWSQESVTGADTLYITAKSRVTDKTFQFPSVNSSLGFSQLTDNFTASDTLSLTVRAEAVRDELRETDEKKMEMKVTTAPSQPHLSVTSPIISCESLPSLVVSVSSRSDSQSLTVTLDQTSQTRICSSSSCEFEFENLNSVTEYSVSAFATFRDLKSHATQEATTTNETRSSEVTNLEVLDATESEVRVRFGRPEKLGGRVKAYFVKASAGSFCSSFLFSVSDSPVSSFLLSSLLSDCPSPRNSSVKSDSDGRVSVSLADLPSQTELTVTVNSMGEFCAGEEAATKATTKAATDKCDSPAVWMSVISVASVVLGVGLGAGVTVLAQRQKRRTSVDKYRQSRPSQPDLQTQERKSEIELDDKAAEESEYCHAVA